ncbi:hypothetical protein A9Q98_15965 [Thalassotalea sp. 42_200_T64]|nr:hypothetical protein A9Q98_15965 [Thalassotalea sp. 42_200_T64]
MKLTLSVILFLCSFLSIANGVSVSVGQSPPRYSGYDYNDAFRIAYIIPLSTKIEFLEQNHITVDVEFSYMQWRDNSKKWGSFGDDWYDDIEGISITPLFKYQFARVSNNLDLFIAAGIGISYHDGINWGYRELGTRWLFEDKLEFSLLYKHKHQFSLSLIHYSNADFEKKNQGANVYSIGYGYHW